MRADQPPRPALEEKAASLHLRFTGGLEKSYVVHPTTACRMRVALANGERGFLAFEAANVVAAVHCAKLNWARVVFDPDPPPDIPENPTGEAALDFQLKLYFDGGLSPQEFEVEPDAVEMARGADEGGADIQWLLAMLEASGDHEDVMSFADVDGEVIFSLSRLHLVEASSVLVHPDRLAAAIDHLGRTQ